MTSFEAKLGEALNLVNLDEVQKEYLSDLEDRTGIPFEIAWPFEYGTIFRGGSESKIPDVIFFALDPFYAAQYGDVSAYKHSLTRVIDLRHLNFGTDFKVLEEYMSDLAKTGKYDAAIVSQDTGYRTGTGYEVAVFDKTKITMLGKLVRKDYQGDTYFDLL